MMDLSFSRWRKGAHYIVSYHHATSQVVDALPEEGEPSFLQVWGAKNMSFMRRETKPDCSWSRDRTILMSVATVLPYSS